MADPAPPRREIINDEVIATLLERYERAIRVTELQYLPVKIGFLATFLTAAFSLQMHYGVIVGFVVWFVLTVVMRPRLVVSMSRQHVTRLIPYFGKVLRWTVAAGCVVYIWLVTRPAGWDGWSTLALIWVLDAAVALLEERQITPYVHWKEQVSRHYQRKP